jgi:hypothetical protein
VPGRLLEILPDPQAGELDVTDFWVEFLDAYADQESCPGAAVGSAPARKLLA